MINHNIGSPVLHVLQKHTLVIQLTGLIDGKKILESEMDIFFTQQYILFYGSSTQEQAAGLGVRKAFYSPKHVEGVTEKDLITHNLMYNIIESRLLFYDIIPSSVFI